MSDSPRDPWEDTLLFPPTTSAVNSYEPPQVRAAGDLEEHRAEIILTVAVISLFPVFGLISILAVAMAIKDLRKMAAGTMDRSGRKQTIAGLVIGVFEILIIVCALLYWAILRTAAA